MKQLTQWLFCLVLLLGNLAQANYDESISGDLSDDNLSPTIISLNFGANNILGTTNNNPFDRDIFTISLNSNQQLDAILLDTYIGPGGGGSFLAVQSGSTINLADASAHLGNQLIGVTNGTQVGDNILDDLGTARFGGIGFDAPLTEGIYTFWLQETAGATSYDLNFQVSEVPLPAAFWLFAAAILGLIKLGRKPALQA